MTKNDAVNGAQELVASLEECGVTVCFGLPGVHNLPIWAALGDSSIRLVGVRHEQTTAYAADGYTRVGGEVGVAITTTGPGAANTVAAVGEAFASGSPLVVIATDIPTGMRVPGVLRGVLHETSDQAAMFEPVVKEAIKVGGREEIGSAVRRAVARALEPPAGPVYVEIPTDLLSAGSVPSALPEADLPPPSQPDRQALAEAARLLAAAERPLIWVGGGAARAGAERLVAELAETLGAPVLETYAGRGMVPPDHPCSVGLPPHVPEAGELWDEADLVLALGSSFDGMMTQNWRMPQPPCLIAVNVDPEAAGNGYAPSLLLHGDARVLAERLLEQLDGATRRPWAEDLEERRSRARDRLAGEDPASATFLESLANTVPDTAKVVCDMCIPGYWAGGFHRFARPRTVAYPVGWGTLGFGFPASLGASLAGGGPTLCICGDGGFLFACGELATVAQEQLPVCILLVDDGGYGMLRYDQVVAGEELLGTDLLTPDWVALSESFGIEAERLDDPGEPLEAALARRLAAAKPAMIVLEAELKPPPTTSPRWYRSASTAATLEGVA